MAQVKWTLQALDDLESICLFIARDAPQIAAVFADRAFRATNRLADYPRSGRIVPELDIENIREIILSNYRLIYRIREDQVQKGVKSRDDYLHRIAHLLCCLSWLVHFELNTRAPTTMS